MLLRRPARAASAASVPLHAPSSPGLLMMRAGARHRARGPHLRDASSPTPSPSLSVARANPPSSAHDPESDEPGRRVAMAMEASWGKKGASPLPRSPPMKKKRTTPSEGDDADGARPASGAAAGRRPANGCVAHLSRSIAASARAAALSSQLRYAHARLPAAGPRALVASIAALAAAADDLDGPAGGARTGACEFFSYALPSSPFLPGWRAALRAALPRMTKGQLADALSSLGRLPYFPPPPLAIGFGTPRYSRPLAASEPDEWEALLEEASAAWLALPAEDEEVEEKRKEEEQEEEEEREREQQGRGGSPSRSTEARFLLGLALSKRWAGLRVGDTWLMSREAHECLQLALSELPTCGREARAGATTAGARSDDGRGAATAAATTTTTTAATTTQHPPPQVALSPAARLAAALLQVRGAPPTCLAKALFDETAAPAADGAPWPASWAAGRRPSSLGSMIAARAGPPPSVAPPPSADDDKDDEPPPVVAPTLSSTLLDAQPTPAPPAPPSALCAALSPRQVQRAARGLVYLGAVPGDAWLRALASASRCALGCGSLDGRELAALRDALRFFAAERRGGTAAGGGGGSACGGGAAAAFAGGEREAGPDRTGLAEAVAVLDEWCVGGSGAF